MKRRILVIIFALTSMLALSACGSGSGSSSTAAPAPVTDEGSSEAGLAEAAESFSQDEELAENTSAENTADDNNIANNNGRPYFELGFSPEDFTFAGYSLADGDHYEEALQVVSEKYWERYEITYNDEGLMTGYYDKVIASDPSYTDWTYWNPFWNEADAIQIQYVANGIDTGNAIFYRPNSSTEVSLSIDADIDNILQEYPFVDGPVMVGMDYDDVISILQLEKLIEYTMIDEHWRSDGDGYYNAGFESQYGAVSCMYHPISEYDADQRAWVHITSFTDNDKQFHFWLGFSDNILNNFDYKVWEQ